MIRVWYHNGCNDGFGAAFVAWKAMGNSQDITYVPVKYGESMPQFSSRDRIYILDFSYPRENIEDLLSYNTRVTILDHHKTSEEALRGLDCATFDMNKSGAMLAWEHFFPTIEAPSLIKYIQDRDLWKFKLPDSKALSLALMGVPFNFETWDNLSPEKLIEIGKTLLEVQKQEIDKVIETGAYMTKMFGYTVPVINTSSDISDTLHELCNRYPDSPFAAGYVYLPNGVRQWSLRSNNKIDVSELARRMNGGGHKSAAGFKTLRASHLNDVNPYLE